MAAPPAGYWIEADSLFLYYHHGSIAFGTNAEGKFLLQWGASSTNNFFCNLTTFNFLDGLIDAIVDVSGYCWMSR